MITCGELQILEMLRKTKSYKIKVQNGNLISINNITQSPARLIDRLNKIGISWNWKT